MTRKISVPHSVARAGQGAKLDAPSTALNAAPILRALGPVLPSRGAALEIASGTGQHVVALAREFPGITWTPSEIALDRIASIQAWSAEADLPNLKRPVLLDACSPGWSQSHGPVDVLVTVNLLHLISDAEMAVLLDQAALAVAPGGLFAIYGPFLRDGRSTSPGDAAFHSSLQDQDPAIGYKDVDDVADIMAALGFASDRVEMPANNLMLLFRPNPTSL